MAGNKTLEYLIDVAIGKEEESYKFYMDLYNKIDDASVKDSLKFLADEEVKHKEFLVAYKSGKFGTQALGMSTVVDYKIAEHLEIPDIEKDILTKDVYLVAAHKELNSYNFYKSLSDVQPAGEVKDMLLKMANEELKHKEKVEYLYSNTAFPQTAGG
ncbi:MAG TPA: ferritin family protein [Spirochaetota bacterium]|nr:ferritin family protein [Spirochaetota bacterium]HPJ34348.1 ferritin family protein [Spirochaetota bacterium]